MNETANTLCVTHAQIECQVWGIEFGSVKFLLGVLESDPHTPKFFAQLGQGDGVEMEFVTFNASTAPAADFDIKPCGGNATGTGNGFKQVVGGYFRAPKATASWF